MQRWLSSIGRAPVIERLQNLVSTPDVIACHVSLRKTLNAILGPSSLPVVVAQPDKRLQTGPFCIGVIWPTQSIMVHPREEDVFSGKDYYKLELNKTKGFYAITRGFQSPVPFSNNTTPYAAFPTFSCSWLMLELWSSELVKISHTKTKYSPL